MASNFKIHIHQNGDALQVQLSGDFDGSSAHQLINALKKHSIPSFSIFIHTTNLKHVYPFGRDIFQSNLHSLNNKFFGNLIFTGTHATEIAPESSKIL